MLRKCLLTVVASLTASSLAARAQLLHPVSPMPAFETATIKPAGDGAPVPMASLGTTRLVHIDAPLSHLIALAYNEYARLRIVTPQPPDPALGERYVVDATIPEDAFLAMQKRRPDEAKRQTQLMLQALLAERFGLRTHFETRDLPIYNIVEAKGGAKLPPALPEPDTASGGMNMRPDGTTAIHDMKLEEVFGIGMFHLDDHVIVNKTPYLGRYDLTLQGAARPVNGDGASIRNWLENRADSIKDSLRKTYGLELAPSHGPVEVLVVDAFGPLRPN